MTINHSKSRQTEAGFTMIEVAIALFMLTIGIFGSYALFQQIIKTTSINQSRLTAYYQIQEVFETIRNSRDSNWLVVPVVSWDNGLTQSCMSPRFSPCDFYGDVNVDGVVTSLDSASCNNCISGGDEFCQRCNVDGDGSITGNDVTAINNYISCSVNTFPVCSSNARFQKQINITLVDPNILKASSTISWVLRGKAYSISAVDYLYNWR